MIKRILFKFITLILGSALIGSGLAACGFTPVHQNDFSKLAFPDIKVVTTEDHNQDNKRASYEIRQNLKTRIGSSNSATSYQLKINPRIFKTRLGLTNQDIASRIELRLQTLYAITDATGKTLETGRVNSSTSFDLNNDPYARIRSEDSAIDRLAKDTADDLVIVLSKFYSDR